MKEKIISTQATKMYEKYRIVLSAVYNISKLSLVACICCGAK